MVYRRLPDFAIDEVTVSGRPIADSHCRELIAAKQSLDACLSLAMSKVLSRRAREWQVTGGETFGSAAVERGAAARSSLAAATASESVRAGRAGGQACRTDDDHAVLAGELAVVQRGIYMPEKVLEGRGCRILR